MDESLHDKLRTLEARVAVLESILDHVNQGISYFNAELFLEFCNKRYLELLDFPDSLGVPGTALETFFRFNAERGEYGPGEIEGQVKARIELARQRQAHRFQRTRPSDNTTLEVVGTPLANGGFVTTYADVSEFKQLEQTTALSKQRMELALEGADLGMWDLDITSGTFTSNPRLIGMVGYVPGELVVNAETFASLLHPEDANAFGAAYFAHLKGETPRLDIEFRSRHKEGHWIWIHCRGKVVERDRDGRAIRMTGTNLDITERKQSEAALRDSENMLKAIIDNEPECVKLLDRNGILLQMNPAGLAMLDADSADQVIGREVSDLCSPSCRTPFMNLVNQVFDGKPGQMEFEIVSLKGTHRWLNTQAVPLRNTDGTVVTLLGITRDITERKRVAAELQQHQLHLEELVEQRTAELRETQAQNQLILESSADGLCGIDTHGLITFINPAACAMLGYEAEQVIGRDAHALFHHSKPDGSPYPVEECFSHHARLTGQTSRVDDEVYWHADGHAIPVMYAMHPMERSGVINGVVISFIDMTEQRAVAQAREQALIAAENLARVRQEFLANMSHEIRTPLHGVLGFANIGQKHYQNSEKALEAFIKIRNSGERLLGVVNDILDFSKIEAGKLHIEQVEVNLPETIEHSVEIVRERAQAKHLDLRVELTYGLPKNCTGDPLRLGQILLNLLSNAVKFTQTGCVTLSASRQNEMLVFRVTDTGIGMNEEQLGHLFNPFHQADASSSRRFGGTGLGLAISKRLLELMGGDIRVESQPGVGSTFEFCLPYVR